MENRPATGVLSELDLHLLAEGTHLRAFEKLGAHPCTRFGVAGTTFAVWAPNARSVSVVGDFNAWDPDRHPLTLRREAGVWEGFVRGVAPGPFSPDRGDAGGIEEGLTNGDTGRHQRGRAGVIEPPDVEVSLGERPGREPRAEGEHRLGAALPRLRHGHIGKPFRARRIQLCDCLIGTGRGGSERRVGCQRFGQGGLERERLLRGGGRRNGQAGGQRRRSEEPGTHGHRDSSRAER